MKKIVVVTLFLILSLFIFGNETKTFTAVANVWAPFVDPRDVKEGLSLEIIRAAFKTQGYKIRMEYMPWARAEAMVKKGNYDILPDVWYTEERAKELMFSDYYAENNIKFVTLRDSDFEFTGLDSLEGKSVGVIRGYGYIEELLKVKDIRIDEAASILANVRKLILDRVDLTLGDEIAVRVTIAEEDSALLEEVRFTENALSSNKLYIAVGYKNPRHKEIIDAFNRGLQILKENGEFDKIMRN